MNRKEQALITPSLYNIYDRGYRTGAQASIFIGPLWVEELLNLQINSRSGDMPVYPYSSAYYSRLMVGRYLISGTIAVAYVEPDYLMRIIEQARNESIQDDELYQMIEGRKSIFANSVAYRRLGEALLNQEEVDLSTNPLTRHMVSYVQRISREVELMYYARREKHGKRGFELTIVLGDMNSDDQIIDIYQDVKITATGKIVGNDDTGQMEIYEFTAKRKPERKQRIAVPLVTGWLSRENLLQMATEVAEQLIDRLLEPPKIKISNPQARTGLMVNTDRLAIAGLLNPNMRMYGKAAQFVEIVWGMEYPRIITSYYDSNRKPVEIKSLTKLMIRTSENKTKYPDIKLLPPMTVLGTKAEEAAAQGAEISEEAASETVSGKGFNNSFGMMLSVDKEKTVPYLTAVGPVEPESITRKLGGTIALLRYKKNDFDIGSFYPPKIVAVDTFAYIDEQLEALTMTTLWCSLLGFRSIARLDRTKRPDGQVVEPSKNLINQIAQPVNSFAYVKKVSAEWTEDETTFRISVPVFLDYMNTHQVTADGKRTAEELGAGKTDLEIVFREGAEGTSVTVEQNGEEADSEISEVYSNIEFSVHRGDEYELEEQEEGEDKKPYFFEFSVTSDNNRLVADFSKCLYVVPFIFVDRGTMNSISHVEGILWDSHSGDWDEEDFDGDEVPENKLEALAFWLSKRDGRDDSCNVMMDYDWSLKSISGYMTQGQAVTIHGVYFLDHKNVDRYYYECGECGESIWHNDLSNTAKVKFRVFWLVAMLPVRRPLSEDKSQNEFEYAHDLESQGGRYVEFYNITRCDSRMMNLALLAEKSEEWWKEILSTIVRPFVEFYQNTFGTVDNSTIQYVYPLKANMNRIAAFTRGYGCKINLDAIVEEVLRCTFSGDITTASGNTVKHPEKNGTPWTLEYAMAVSLPGSSRYNPDQSLARISARDGIIPADVYAELSSMIRNIFKEQCGRLGFRIEDEQTESGTVRIERDLLTPAPSVVAWGLTQDGKAELESIAGINSNAETEDSETGVTAIKLGGYDV